MMEESARFASVNLVVGCLWIEESTRWRGQAIAPTTHEQKSLFVCHLIKNISLVAAREK
jgi:hypothetical protein